MGERRAPLNRWGLAQLLLIVTAIELALYRLAVPALMPTGAETPPWWHQALNYAGLFLFYFCSALALGLLALELARHTRRSDLYAGFARWWLVGAGSAFIIASLIDTVVVPSEAMSIWLEVAFALTLLGLIAAQLTRPGDLGARVGLALMTMPLFIHFYGVVRALFLDEEIATSQSLGQWSLVLAALVSPYCFAPRPFLRAATRVGPLVVAVFVGVIGAVVLRQNYVVGMELAARGLGIEIPPAAPTSMIALYLMGLGALAWTLASTLTSPSPARRHIGVGVGLLFVGGYGFAWPLQYLVSLVGLMAIGAAARVVREEETGFGAETARYRVPPIQPEVWAAWIAVLVEKLRGIEPDAPSPASSVTVEADEGAVRTHVVATLGAVPLRLTVERQDGSIGRIDIVAGELPSAPGAPAWTLHACPPQQVGVHPEPPRTPAPLRRTGDEPFDARFHIRDADTYSDVLLDETGRSRAVELVDGWLAVWPRQGLQYRVHPGRGAPLDNPIPITELAFRASAGAASADRMTALLQFLADLVARLQPDRSPSGSGTAGPDQGA